MEDEHVRFRDLSKLTKKVEAAFHAAGMLDWPDLAAADADALATIANSVRETSDAQIVTWQEEAAVRADEHRRSVLVQTDFAPRSWRTAVELSVAAGGERPIAETISADRLPAMEIGSYFAQLLAQPIGCTAALTPLAAVRGAVGGGEDLVLDFGSVNVPHGAHRLRIRLEIEPTAGAGQPGNHHGETS